MRSVMKGNKRLSSQLGAKAIKAVAPNPFLSLIISNPWVILVVLAIIVIFIVYLLVSADVYLTQLVDTYQSLSARPNDSKAGFDKRLFFITVNDEGVVTVTVGYRTEQEKEMAEAAVNEAAGTTSTTLNGISMELSADESAVKDALILNGYDRNKATAMAKAYGIINPVLGTNAAIGLMANIACEGSLGVVEYSFSSNHVYGFRLPSGGSIMTTIEDINYVRNWDSTTDSGNPMKGSCGVGSVQWSFDRRVAFLDVALSIMRTDADVTSDNWILAEVIFMSKELTPGSGYYTAVSSHVGENTVENWAEAFCDYYEKPHGWCGKNNRMTGRGSQCIARRAEATKIAGILGGL